MGLDLVDMSLQIEEEFGVKIEAEQWEAIASGRKPWDVTGADVLRFIRREIGEGRRACMNCRYDLRGHPSSGVCPECGSQFGEFEGNGTWLALRKIISLAIGVAEHRITPDSRLVGDLGML